ncbi:MAG: tetratricopeptide repeat protein [Thermoanaerobaculia bacterium]|nr:tetratricopeptide repeat protein [Thermoanaerobaculia bacterium]
MLKISMLCLLLQITVLAGAFAQNRGFGTLPLALKPGAPGEARPKMENNPKYEQALKVYNRLVAARGDFRYPVPAFSLCREERSVAYMDYDRLEIMLEEKAFDVCAGFGNAAESAIAFLLGHELTHYYEKHAWRRGFVSEFKDLKIGMTIDSLVDDAANETEADYLGGFLAYSAGYGMFDRGAEMIRKLYTAYGLPEQLPGYPALADREVMSRRTAEKLARLVEVFEMANLLTATGNYAEACQYYRFVLMEYQSREIYNNLGVTLVLDALQYFKTGELKFRYPLELDLNSSAIRGLDMAGARNLLLRQALQHFDAAISLDPNYAPAYLNKACAFALLGDAKRARFYAGEEAQPIAQQNNYAKTALDAAVLLGILEADQGNTEQAKQLFQHAAAGGSAVAAVNLRLLNKEPLAMERSSTPGPQKAEKIDGQSLAAIADNARFDPDRSVALSKDLSFHQNPEQGANSRLFISQNERTKMTTFFHITVSGYTGKTIRQIGLGDDRSAIVSAYGEAQRTIETPFGQIMVYKRILFILDANGKLTRWANYHQFLM